ncbi:terpenoid cyclases/protein prenyltransferase alpha-alpha toroid [Phycomyces nitens]|nr:terpenoid cyclases/protein prenyltransferase alpha-alpha toroid [Phycomyces nitens]
MGILKGSTSLAQLRIKDDGLPSETSISQKSTEDSILECYADYAPNNPQRKPLESVNLERDDHVPFLKGGLEKLSKWMVGLDASKPWMVYWILHSLTLMEESLSQDIIDRAISSFSKWQSPTGGFGGGSDQLAHLATTYGSINALAIIGTKEAYDLIDRKTLYEFLLRMKQPDGSFTMHEGGEIDIRGSYCALSVAALTNLFTPELTENCIEFICRSQTYEGGIGPYPGKEAHNGYTFCGLAAMELLGGMSRLNMDKMLKWCSGRQMELEGGFQGRTNKLVDGCYSFWGAGDFPILSKELESKQTVTNEAGIDYLFDREALQEYILICCQSDYGGLVDKPGKGPDYYHTCYCLSGLSTCQHLVRYDTKAARQISARGIDAGRGGISSLLWTVSNECVVVGNVENLLAPTHPVHNIPMGKARAIVHHFYENELEQVLDLLPKDEDAWEA